MLVLRPVRKCYATPRLSLFALRLLICGLSIGGAQGQQAPDPDPTTDAANVALNPVRFSVVITATLLGPQVDYRSTEVFNQTLFSRDDQVFHQLNAGINAGQHEGGGKSLEIRRFGFNLDHGGAAGGLKVLVDNVPQNQSTQGHGQGYLGSLKSLSPELIEEALIYNGPFSAEYGDYSGLGVVHIRQRESLPQQWTVRLQGGSFNNRRAFFAFSPNVNRRDALFAYEGSHTDGPFQKPLGYRRDNVTGNYTWILDDSRFGLKWNGGRNDFNSSGQLPLDEVAARRLDRYGFLSPGDGGHVIGGRLGAYYRKDFDSSSVLKVDGFVERSLFDLYSNFTFSLNDPVNGDGIQQHDSRLSEGGNVQYLRSQVFGAVHGQLTIGANYLDSQTDVALLRSVNRNPIGVHTSAHARVTNGGGYVQEDLSLLGGRLNFGGGLRWDFFRFGITDFFEPAFSGVEYAAKLQPKANVSFLPTDSVPVKLYCNYGRGISSMDARGVVRRRGGPHIATTDFYEAGASSRFGDRLTLHSSLFRIESSNQLVYIPDDGSIEFSGPARSYGFEVKTSAKLTRTLSLDGGITKVLNAYFRDTAPRVYLDSAPRFVMNGALTLTNWHGWSGSLRMRAINRYRLAGLDPSILASGHTLFDFAFSRRLSHSMELGVAVDNLFDREYWETQNYFTSRLPGQPALDRIHATPGYGTTVTVGLTFRFAGK